MPNSTLSFRMTLSDLEWLSKIFNEKKRRSVSLQQLSCLLLMLAVFINCCLGFFVLSQVPSDWLGRPFLHESSEWLGRSSPKWPNVLSGMLNPTIPIPAYLCCFKLTMWCYVSVNVWNLNLLCFCVFLIVSTILSVRPIAVLPLPCLQLICISITLISTLCE